MRSQVDQIIKVNNASLFRVLQIYLYICVGSFNVMGIFYLLISLNTGVLSRDVSTNE